MIKALFLDIDDTILDYDKCAVITLQDACKTLGVPYSQEVQTEYRRIDDEVWARQKLGELTIPQVLEIRNAHMMNYFGLQDGISFQDAFMEAFANSAEPTDGVEAALQLAKDRGLPIYSASNGFIEVQINRLTKAGLLHYFDKLFVSNNVGYEKPDPRFFAHCLEATGFAPREVLMIGDSITADIKGAMQAGWNVCFYNKHGRDSGLDCPEIRSWTEFEGMI